jgi:dihydrodipicolinate synthase/N-acetylneuraminate lyase
MAEGDEKTAQAYQQKMNRLMYAVYGGKKIKAWLSGEKYLLVRLGLFKTYKNFPDYPLTEREKAAIDKIIEREKAFLLP